MQTIKQEIDKGTSCSLWALVCRTILSPDCCCTPRQLLAESSHASPLDDLEQQPLSSSAPQPHRAASLYCPGLSCYRPAAANEALSADSSGTLLLLPALTPQSVSSPLLRLAHPPYSRTGEGLGALPHCFSSPYPTTILESFAAFATTTTTTTTTTSTFQTYLCPRSGFNTLPPASSQHHSLVSSPDRQQDRLGIQVHSHSEPLKQRIVTI